MSLLKAAFTYAIDPPDARPDQWSFKLSHAIDFMKGVTPLVILACMWHHAEAPYHAWDNHACWVYFGVHGCYGLLWVLKGVVGFGDKKWTPRKHIIHMPSIMLALGLYWMPIWLLCQQTVHDTPGWLLGVSIMSFGLGVFFHFCSDMQKTLFLEYRAVLQKDKATAHLTANLLSTKLWAFSRNPNYFGELLIYSSFCMLPRHPLPWLWLSFMVGVYWMYNMVMKERSLSRFGKEFDAYKRTSAFFIPYVW